MRIRLRQKQLIYAGLIGALVTLLLALGGGYWGFSYIAKAQAKRDAAYEQKLAEAQKLLDQQKAAKKTIWVLKEDLNAGQEILDSNLESIDVLKETVPENTVGKEIAVGKKTKIALKKGTPLVEPMLFEDGVTPNDLREQETRVVTLPSNLKKDDFVDVRISFPTGGNYVLLAKKQIKDLAAASGTIWFEIDEKEILTLSSGIVDAYINDATITAIKYSDPYMQDKAAVTYPTNQSVTDLIKADPNIVSKATAELERRNRQKLESDLKDMDELSRGKFKQGMQGSSIAPSTSGSDSAASGSITQKETVKGGYPVDSTQSGKQDTSSGGPLTGPQTSSKQLPPPVITAPMPTPPPAKTEEEQRSVFGADPDKSVPLNQ
ncbi:SAF domain-containing protein [Paenibacillus sp. 1P03SA]|uniref:SAF domain-containing protein n=1 Tax=Paenibacillus sp. 1P03SA TaxID=3132294 RepID=UPI0039A2A16D